MPLNLYKLLIMRTLNIIKVFFAFVILLISNALFSNTCTNNNNYRCKNSKISLLTVTSISPVSGHAGTVVTITGTNFTVSSVVALGGNTIPSTNVQFVSATTLQVILPCGLTSDFFKVDGIASTTLFTYSDPTLSTTLPNLAYCVGATVPPIALTGTPAVATTPTGLQFSWTNTNPSIGLIASGTGNIPTFTCSNTTFETISSTITVTPSINGCNGVSKSYTITINPKPVATPITNLSVCNGANVGQISLTASSPNSGTGTSFSWSGTNNAAIGLATPSGSTSPIPAFTAINATNNSVSSTITVQPTFAGCIGNPINFTIDVSPVTLGGTLSSSSSVCAGTTSGVLTLTGYRGAVLNWEYSTNGLAPWTPIANTAATYQSGALSQTTYFRVAVQNTACPIVYSTIVTITINSLPTIVGTLSICNGSSTTLTGSGTAALNAWQSSNTGIASVTSSGLVTGISVGSSTITYTNNNGCSATAIVVVNAVPSAPIAASQTFLSTDNATVSYLQIISSGAPKWYSTSTGVTALSASTIVTTGIYYASQIVNGCESTNRTSVNVSITASSSGGSVSGSTTVCFGTNSTNLTLSGYVGSILGWQSSTVSDFSSNVVAISVQSATYTATNLTSSLYFRAEVQNGNSPSTFSSPAFINVLPQINGGTLSSSTAVCLGQNSGLLTLTGYNGTIVRWEQSIDSGANWSPIATTSDTYTSGALSVTTQYRVVVQNGSCTTGSSSVAIITVKNTPVVTDIPNQQVCFGDTKTFGDPFVAGYTYSWISDIGYSSFLPQISLTFNQVVTQIYTYTITNSATGCSTQDQFQVIVNPLPNATVIASTSICAGDSISIGSNPSIGSTYSWASVPSGFISTSSNPSVNPAVTTTYLLEETNSASSCKKTNSVTVTVQPIPVITIVGAPQFNICETTSQVQLNATITNPYSTFVWTKIIGTGSFDNNTILNPIYSPSTADVVAGSVTLRLSVIGSNPCTANFTQDVVIIIDKKPIANAGLDVITCGTNPIQIDANGTLNATNLVWSLPAGISGTLNQSNPYSPIFTPSANDLNYLGPIVLTLTASSNTTCPSANDTVSVLITPAPKVDAGPPSVIICEGYNYFVPFNPMASDNIVNSTILWTNGTGDGTIVGGTTLTPTYIPGINDIANGSVTLTLSASGNNPCSTPATDTILINIVKNPIVNAGPDTTICDGSINVNATIQNAGTILWTVQNGNGSFVNPTVISPIYIPALTDLNTTVTFTVTVTPINNCGPAVSDSVLYTINAKPTVVAGGDATICQSNSSYHLQATATNTTSTTWTSTGSGSFDNISNEDPIYTLSPNDIIAGSVTFTITGTQAGCANDTDTMVLTIQKNPTADAGIAQVICQGDIVIIPGSSNNSTTNSWIRSGGTGTFINANTVNPTYTSQLTESGTIYLTLIADAIAPCTGSASSDTTITIVPKATADAGLDAQICEGATYSITTASASNNVGVQWSTNGDGTFTGGSTITPTYTPGPSDNNNGSVILTLVATKNFPCNANAVDQMTLTINKIPVITVINPNVDLCVGDPSYIVTGVIPTNYDNLVWSTSGSGTFSPNNTALAPTYFPSASDYTLGTVTLTLTASRNPLNCNSSTSNTITLHFISKPTADAGSASASICEGFSYVTNGATATYYANVTWATSGSGTFTNVTTLLATYTPSGADYNLGFVNLTLSANPLNPCLAIITDVIRLDLQKLPVITVRANDAICVSQNTYAIGGTSVTNYVANSEVWTSSGTGTFSPSGDSLNPIYNPSTDDLAAGSVTLTLTVNSITPCIVPVSNSFVLSFQKLPVAIAGPTLTECDTPFHITTATATLNTINSLVWSTSGTGTFDYTNVLDPIYTPSAFDVLNSPITLTLTGNAMAPCTVNSVSTVTINLVKSPVITVANQLPICEDATNVTVLGTTVSNQSSFIWTSATGTTISNTAILNPIVTPSAQDILNNQILLTITALPIAPCGTPVLKTVTIPIQKKPSVFSGAAQTICEGIVISTSDAVSSNVTNLHWTNNGGDGTFTSSNLNTVTEYTPGAAEIASGQVLLTLIGDAIAPCSGTVSSTISHTIVKNPIVTINPTQVTICETETSYTVPSSFVTLINPSSIFSYQWTTTNMASLTGDATWTPTYTPTAADIATGFATLTLTVIPIGPCTTPIIKTLKINIAKQATISFVNDGFFCESNSKPLTATFTNYNPGSISWTIINGTGTLTGANTASPTYIPALDSGTVVIRISATSLAPCSNVVVQDFTITMVKKPIVTMATILDTVCSSQLTYNLTGNTAQFANTIQWTRVNPIGTGTFSNSTILSPIYTFNAADITNGFVTLRLTASSTANCSLTDYKEITINITKEPTVVTAPTDSVCQGSVYSASATTADSTSVLWTTVGTSNGLFTNANQLVTQYTPGSNDINSFTIQITANGNAPCAAVTAIKTVIIQKNPIIDAGIENRYNCSSLPYQITGVTGQNLGAVLWSSNSGTPGTFSDPTSLNPTYTPSLTELTAGNPIILNVTAQAVAPCLVSVSDFIVLNLTPNQEVNAGTYSSICEGSLVNLTGSVTNASSIYWTTSGTGTFASNNSLITTYTPSNSDIINTNVTLTLNAVSDTNCPIVSNATQITIIKKPTANAGTNVSICEGSSYTLAAGDATAQNYTSLSWTATGPGALNLGSINTLIPTYVPAPGQTGTVTLTLTAVGNSACGINAVSQKTITIVPQPFVTIPSSKTICEGSTLVISNNDASATDYSSLQWTSSNGLGTFSSTSTPATIYTPATGQTSTVTLTLTASSPNGVCPSASSPLVLTIIPKPIVEAGTNGTICQTGTFTVSGASVQNSTLYSWSVSGAATILSGTENTLNPVIVPNTGATGTVTVTLTAIGNGICPVVITDFITIQINPIPVVNAGANGSLCEGSVSYPLNGTVTNATSYTWTTTGGGLIQQTANPLAPIYIPSASDYNTATGINVITITLNATTTNSCNAVTDSMQLTLYAKPKVNAGIDLVACHDSSSVLLNGASISNYNSGYTVSWSSTGNGTWDYSGSNGGVNPVYIFGSNDTSSVILIMAAIPNSSCPQVAVTDSMTITINQNPSIVASSNEITMCGGTFTMPDLVTVNNSSSILWTNTTVASGTPGVLTNATTETPIFTPSANEIANGFALLTLTALPPSGCSVPAVKVIRVNLQPKAVVYAGTNITACQGEVVTVNNNASVQNYTTYSWSENGTGTIDSSTINTLNPKYYPGNNETGVVTFTLQATDLTPCIGLVTQTMTLTILAQPTVNAGPDVTICQNINYVLGAATVSNTTSMLWSSSQNSNGTSNSTYVGGTFNNSTIINPSYTPSQDDINLGYVYLTVRATNTSCNTIVTDLIKITISGGSTVAAGSNATICEGAAFTLAVASQNNASSLNWSSSQNSNGTSSPTYISGSFSNTSVLNPIYTPSLDDINLGHVYLTLTGSGGSNCPSSSSQIELTIVKKPTVSTTDVQICMSTPQIGLNGFVSNYQSFNWSIYSGPGSISPNIINPLNPTFISGISGLNTVQTTVVRLLVTPLPGCATTVYDDLIITIQPLPSVEAGVNGSVCYTSGQPITTFVINGTVVTNANTQNWTTSGAGIFSVGTPVSYQSLSNSCSSDVLTLTANGIGACSASTVSDSVTLTINCTIPSLGTIISSAPTTICQGATATYTIPSVSNVQTYNWIVPTGATIQSGQGTNTIQVLYSTTASSGNISVTASNGCGSVIASLPIIVNTLPTGVSISGPQTVCAGATNIVYTASIIPNATSYVWTLPNGTTITTATNSITTSYGLTEVSGNLSVSGSNACGIGSAAATFPITIKSLPTLLTTLTPPAICSGTAFTYSPSSATPGSTFTWTRATQFGISNPTGSGNGSISETLINTTTTIISVVYQITISAQGCTNTQSVIVAINPIPSLTSSLTPAAICSGSTFNYAPTSPWVGTISWVRNTITGITELGATGSGPVNEVLTNNTSSPIAVSYLFTIPAAANGCSSSNSIPVTVNVNPLPVFTVTNPAAVCSPSTVNITNVTSGTPGLVYTYWNDSATINSLSNPNTVSSSGTYYIKATNSNGCSTINSVVVTINPVPVFTVTNPAAVCSPSTVNITNSASIVAGLTYTYWNDSAATVSQTNPNSIATSGTYYIKATNSFGCFTISPVAVTINPSPSLTSNTTPNAICSGSTFNYTPTSLSVGTITWTRDFILGISNPAIVVPSSSAINEVLNNTTNSPITVVYNLNVPATANGCTNATPLTLNLVVNPLPVFTVTNPTAVCSPSTVDITNAASGSASLVYSYWNNSTATNSLANPTAISVSGTYYIKATNLYGCSTINPVIVTINPIPVFTVTNLAAVCSPNTVDITNATVGSSPGLIFSYWNNNLATIALANPNAVSVSGTYYIKATNSFGCFTISPVVVTINPSPVATISGQNNFIICQNGTQPVITFTGSNGTAPFTFSYQIDMPTGPISTVTTPASSTSASIAFPTSISGNHTVTLLSITDSSNSTCNSTTIALPNTAYVEVQQVGTITPVNQNVVSQTVCQGTVTTPILFNIGGAATNAYATNLPTGLVQNYSSGIFTISGIPTVPGIYNYVVHTSGSTNGCNSIYSGTITVNSNDSLTALFPSNSNQSVCSNVAILPIVYNLGGGATGGIVTFSPPTPAGITWNNVANVVTISGASSAVGTYTYTVQSFGLCGQSTATGTITINNLASVTLVSGNPSPTICMNASFPTPIRYSITPSADSLLISGSLPTGVAFNAITGTLSGTPSQSGTFPYTISSVTGCGNTLSGVITVNPLQSISYVSGNTNQVTCQYSPIDPINFTLSPGVTTVSVNPALPNGITATIVGGNLTISGTPTVSTGVPSNYIITTQGTCGTQATYSVTLDILPEATIVFSNLTALNQSVCQSSPIVPITFTIGGGATGVVTSPLQGLTLVNLGGGVYTLQGNPTNVGINNISITTTGCPKTVFITISNVNSSVGISLTSPAGTDNQTLCQTGFISPIQPIIYSVIGATSIVANGLPAGVTAVYSPTTSTLIISGTATTSGIFNYTITSLPCSIVKTGVIRISTPIFLTNELVTDVSCSSNNDGTIAVTIVGGVSYNGLYAIHWSGPNGYQQNQTSINGLQAGQYVLTGTDAIGCPIPTMTYTVQPALPIAISLQSSTNVSCNGVLGSANFNIAGGSGIFTQFTLQFLDPSSTNLVTILPPNNNYYNITNLQAGLYYLTVKDSKNCTSTAYLFTIYDYSSLSISTIAMDTTLCQDTPGKIRIKVNSLDQNLSFYYNSVLVPFVALGNNLYELSINAPTVPTGIIKVKNGQNCWVTKTVSTAIITPDFSFTSSDFTNYGYFSVNGSVQITNLVNMSSIPAEYDHIVWDFGDNTPFKVFYNPADLLPNSNGDNFQTVFHTYTTNGIYQITLTVYNQFGCSRKVTKTIIIGSGATLMLPTIFTPNNDGINDLFRPSLLGMKDVSMYIYDDWGNLVYQVSSVVSALTSNWGWDGIEIGKNEPINNDYRYYIIATTINDLKVEKEGRFLLVK